MKTLQLKTIAHLIHNAETPADGEAIMIEQVGRMMEQVIGKDAYIDYSIKDTYGAGQIELLEAINFEKSLQRQIAKQLMEGME